MVPLQLQGHSEMRLERGIIVTGKSNSQSVNKAKTQKKKQEPDVLQVNNNMCSTCDKETCSGLNFVMVPTSLKNHSQPIVQEYHWCKLCFGKTDHQSYFHTSNDKRASDFQICQVAEI